VVVAGQVADAVLLPLLPPVKAELPMRGVDKVAGRVPEFLAPRTSAAEGLAARWWDMQCPATANCESLASSPGKICKSRRRSSHRIRNGQIPLRSAR